MQYLIKNIVKPENNLDSIVNENLFFVLTKFFGDFMYENCIYHFNPYLLSYKSSEIHLAPCGNYDLFFKYQYIP